MSFKKFSKTSTMIVFTSYNSFVWSKLYCRVFISFTWAFFILFFPLLFAINLIFHQLSQDAACILMSTYAILSATPAGTKHSSVATQPFSFSKLLLDIGTFFSSLKAFSTSIAFSASS